MGSDSVCSNKRQNIHRFPHYKDILTAKIKSLIERVKSKYMNNKEITQGFTGHWRSISDQEANIRNN